MSNAQLNIDNLTRLWKVAGEAFQNYYKDEAYCYSHIKNSEWPNRIWTDQTISEETLRKVKLRMEKENGLTFSSFNENSKKDPLVINNAFNLKSAQYGMSLPLTKKFETHNSVSLQKVTIKRDAEIWSKAFYEAFQYDISAETVFKTKKDIQYFLVYHEKELVGTIVLFTTYKVAGIHSLSILPSKRKQGFAQETMHQILNTAIDQNLTLATLQASEMAKTMYVEMDFSIDFMMENFNLKY